MRAEDTVICCQFIFTPGTYDDEFHRLDSEIDAFARGLNGFIRTETWYSDDRTRVNAVYYFTDRDALAELARFAPHRDAKSKVDRWYDGYTIVLTEVLGTYGTEEPPAH